MNKRFIRVAVFCALTATAAPVFVGCSDDYDADIANLQDQINKINGVVGITGDDMAAAINEVVEQMQTQIDALSATVEGKVNVDELTSQVNALSNLIDQKADPSQIQAEAERLQGLIEAANQAAADANATDRQALEEQIAALETAQEEAERILNDALNGKVDQNTLNEEAARLEGLIDEAKKIAEGAVTSEQLDQQINDLQGKLTDAIATATSDMATNADVQAKLDALDKALTDAIATATNDMATNDAVQQKLDALDEALSTAISDLDDSKMSVATFNSLRTELLNAIGAKADTSFVNAQLKQLNAELKTVKDGYATTTITDGLRKDVDAVTDSLVNVNNRLAALEKLNDQVGSAIADIKKLQDDCLGYANRIQALEDAEIKLTDYAEFTNLANRVEALEKTWGAAVRDSIDANTNAIEEINRKLNGYIDEQAGTEVQGIFARLTTLERWKSDNEAALLSLKTKVDVSGLAEGEVADIAQILIDIEQLQLQLGVIGQPGEGEEENTSNFYNKEEIDSKFSELETKMTNLYGEIGLMVQSIVYVPWANGEDTYSSDGNLEFNTLFLTKVSTTTPVAQNGSHKMAFRVSPAAAAARVAEEYDLVLDGKRVKTAADLPISVGEATVDPTTGIITYDIDFNADAIEGTSNTERRWIFCATLKPKAEAATQAEGDAEESKLTDKLTDITSDYFIARTNDTKVDDVKMVHNNLSHELAYKTFEASNTPGQINLSQGVTYEGWYERAKVVDNLVSKFNLTGLSATFTKSNDTNNAFNLSGSTLTPQGGSSNVGSTANVSATINYNGTKVGEWGPETFEITLATYRRTFTLNTTDFTLGASTTVEPDIWTSATRTFTLSAANISSIQDALDLGPTDFTALSGSEEENGIKIEKKADSDDITVTYAANTYLTAPSSIVLTMQTRTAIQVELTVNLPAMSLPVGASSLTNGTGFWINNNLGNYNLNLAVDGYNQITAVAKSTDLTSLFINYYDNEAESINGISNLVKKEGGNIEWEVINPIKGLSLNGSTLTIGNDYDKTQNNGKLLRVRVSANFPAAGISDITLREFDLDIQGLNSTVTPKLSATFSNLAETLNLAKGWTWSIATTRSSGIIWKDGEPTSGREEEETVENRANAMASETAFVPETFGLEEPTFELAGVTIDGETVENPTTYVTLSGYNLSITETGKQNLVPGTELKVTVKVTVKSRFDSASQTYTMTVTAQA